MKRNYKTKSLAVKPKKTGGITLMKTNFIIRTGENHLMNVVVHPYQIPASLTKINIIFLNNKKMEVKMIQVYVGTLVQLTSLLGMSYLFYHYFKIRSMHSGDNDPPSNKEIITVFFGLMSFADLTNMLAFYISLIIQHYYGVTILIVPTGIISDPMINAKFVCEAVVLAIHHVDKL